MLRVIFHGALHLCGFRRIKQGKRKNEEMENFYLKKLKMFHVNCFTVKQFYVSFIFVNNLKWQEKNGQLN